jgi:hypothetical protein
VLFFDETWFIKNCDASAGVARHYTGTSGKVDNCQTGMSEHVRATAVRVLRYHRRDVRRRGPSRTTAVHLGPSCRSEPVG